MNKKILGLALAATFTTGAANATITLDGFNSGGVVTSFNALGANGPSIETGSADSISTDRSLTSEITSQAGQNFLDASANAAGAVGLPGLFSISLGAGVNGESALDWGTFSATDLTEGGMSNAVRFILPSMDLIGTELILTLNGTSSSFTTNIDTLTNAALGDATVDFLLSDFTGVTAITSASFQIIGVENLDLTIDSVGTVCSGNTSTGNGSNGQCSPVTAPEPMPLALLGIGLAAFSLRRLKTKS